MKIMHKTINVISKIEESLEKESKELISLSYGTITESDMRNYVGIAYKPNAESPYCYDVITYDNETDNFSYYLKDITYSYALRRMGKYIEKMSYND